MEQAANARGAQRLASALVATFALMGSTSVLAAEASDSGLLKFSNVTVVNAPAAESAAINPPSGMRVYKDSANAPVRGPTSEERQAEASAAASRNAVSRRAVASDSSSAPAASSSFASNGGGVGQTLDESFLQYSVVVRQPDGSLAEVCVTGTDKADEINRTKPALKQLKEMANDR